MNSNDTQYSIGSVFKTRLPITLATRMVRSITIAIAEP